MMSKHKKRKNLNENKEGNKRKTFHKVELHKKLQIISAVEKGRTRLDISKEFHIHPCTVTDIYKRRHILRQSKQKSFGPEFSTNLNQYVLNWFVQRVNSNRPVVERDIIKKVEQISNSTYEGRFKFNKGWFASFKRFNNIAKHKGLIEGAPSKQDCVPWLHITEGLDEQDIYVGGTCALLHMDDLQHFISNNLSIDNYVSVLLLTNITGSDQRKLQVVGNGVCQTDTQSLPLEYFHKNNAKFDNFIISNLLLSWDYELKQQNRKILLAFLVPDTYLDSLHLEQIKILKCTDIVYIMKTFSKIVKCFKYHYRKLQIMQTLSFRKNEFDFMDYVRMLSLAWHSVSPQTIYNIFHPRFDGYFYFNNLKKHNLENEENAKLSLSKWCITHGIQLNLEGKDLDHFIVCDNELTSLDEFLKNPNYTNVNDWISQQNGFPTTSAIDTFQAAKRLLRYVQSENGSLLNINSMKFLEDQFEVEACIEVQETIDDINSTN